MKAVVAYGKNDYRLDMVDVPIAEKGEIILKVEACGICAGDAKAWKGAPRFWGNDVFDAYVEPPATPGHEFIGTIVELGEGMDDKWQIGDRVISEQIVPCGKCVYCLDGRYSICEKHDVYGFKNYLNGGMAEYVKLPVGSINYKLPSDMPLEKAILIEPFSCSKHCIDRAGIGSDDIVVLAGAGTLGLGMVGAAKLMNPKKLIVLDLIDERLEKAKAFGADIVLNPNKVDVVSYVLDYTDGYGCDIYIDTTGYTGAVPQGLEMIRKQGTFVEFSVFNEDVTVDWSVIGDGKELTIKGVSLSPDCYDSVIEWIGSGKLPTDGVVTHKFSLDEWEKAFKIAERGDDGAIKVVLVSE